MVYLEDIRKRQMYQNINRVLTECSFDVLIENSKKTTSIDNIETYFKNWPYNKNENYYEFNEAVNILDGFIKRTKYNSDKVKAINLFVESVLPKTSNLKSAKHILESLNVDVDTSTLLSECDKYITCDRVLHNHKRLIDLGIMNVLESESTLDLDNYITTICEFIDNINMDFAVKYNVTLENTLYLLNKQGIKYDRKSVLESINDYFFINLDENKLEIMKTVLEKNELYSEQDKENIIQEGNDRINKAKQKSKKILDEFKAIPNKTPELLKSFIRKLYTKSSEQIIEELPNFLTWIRKFLVFSITAISPYLAVIALIADLTIQIKLQRDETAKIIKTFKKEKEKSQKKLESIKSESQRKRLEQYINQLDKNIKKIEDYNDTLYPEKERYGDDIMDESTLDFEDYIVVNEYIQTYHNVVVKQMNESKAMLERYINSRYKNLVKEGCILLNSNVEFKTFENADENTILNYINPNDNRIYINIGKLFGLRYNKLNENTTINTEEVVSDICRSIQLHLNDDFGLTYDGTEDLYNIYLVYNKPILSEDDEEPMHESIIKTGSIIMALDEQVSELSKKDMNYLIEAVDKHIEQMDIETVRNISEFSMIAPDLINHKKLLKIFEEKSDNLRRQIGGNEKYIKLTKINEGVSVINNTPILESDYLSIYDTYENNKLLLESIDLIDQILNEASPVTIMRMAQQKLKNKMKTLSDKEKQISRQIDYTVETLLNKLQTAAANDRREAVIKGSIIPSASKLIKTALATDVVYAINPALAAIGALGGLAASKMATEKERRYILDEINIQLKVVEKKIQIADRNDDMKTLEQLLKVEQKLKKEKARIEYHKKDYMPIRKDD